MQLWSLHIINRVLFSMCALSKLKCVQLSLQLTLPNICCTPEPVLDAENTKVRCGFFGKENKYHAI